MRKGLQLAVLVGLLVLAVGVYAQPAQRADFDIMHGGQSAWVEGGRQQLNFDWKGKALGATYDETQDITMEWTKAFIGSHGSGYFYAGVWDKYGGGNTWFGYFLDTSGGRIEYLYLRLQPGDGGLISQSAWVGFATTSFEDYYMRLQYTAATVSVPTPNMAVYQYYGSSDAGELIASKSKDIIDATGDIMDVTFTYNWCGFGEAGGGGGAGDPTDFGGHFYNFYLLYAVDNIKLTIGGSTLFTEYFNTDASFFSDNFGDNVETDYGWPAAELNPFGGKSGGGMFEPDNFRFTQPGKLVLEVKRGTDGFMSEGGRGFLGEPKTQDDEFTLQFVGQIFANDDASQDRIGFFRMGPLSEPFPYPYVQWIPYIDGVHVWQESSGALAPGAAGSVDIYPYLRIVDSAMNTTQLDSTGMGGPYTMTAGTDYFFRVGYDVLALGGPAAWFQVYQGTDDSGTEIISASLALPEGTVFSTAGGYGGAAGLMDGASGESVLSEKTWVIDWVEVWDEWKGPEVPSWEVY